MENKSRLYQNIYLLLVFGLGLSSLYAAQAEEAPRIILFFGRFHPLLLHLPIGGLLLTFFLDIVGRIQQRYPREVIQLMLGFTALFALFTCF